MSNDWFTFQEEICTYFNSIGANSETNIKLNGIRTSHDIDILVKTKFLGHNLTWLVEAKKWQRKISKFQVLGLRTIVDDIGADKGFIISEKGFQRGAIEASKNTNIKLLTFEELKLQTKEFIEDEILKTYRHRLEILETRYWSHSKLMRKKYGLRGEPGDFPTNFSGHSLLLIARSAIDEAVDHVYPINLDTFSKEKRGDLVANNFQQVINWLNLNLNFLDEKILLAEIKMIQNGDFNPLPSPRDECGLPIEMIVKGVTKVRKRRNNFNAE